MSNGYSEVRISYGGESVVMSWNGSEASAPIKVDGQPIGRQTADARHYTQEAVRLVCKYVWPEVDDWSEGSDAWAGVEYEAIERSEVVTYAAAYPPRRKIDLCEEHAASPPADLPALGPVEHGRHEGTCEVCARS